MPSSTNRRAQRANPLDTLGADLAGLMGELDTPPAPVPVAEGMFDDASMVERTILPTPSSSASVMSGLTAPSRSAPAFGFGAPAGARSSSTRAAATSRGTMASTRVFTSPSPPRAPLSPAVATVGGFSMEGISRTGEVPTGKKAEVVFIAAANQEKLCRGIIGATGSVRFCISQAQTTGRFRGTCGKATHNKAKAKLPAEDAFYLPATISQLNPTAFSTPCLLASHAKAVEGYQNALMGKKHTTQDWEKVFAELELAYQQTTRRGAEATDALPTLEENEDQDSYGSGEPRDWTSLEAPPTFTLDDPIVVGEGHHSIPSDWKPHLFTESLDDGWATRATLEELQNKVREVFFELNLVAEAVPEAEENLGAHVQEALAPIIEQVNMVSRHLTVLAEGLGSQEERVALGENSIMGAILNSRLDPQEMQEMRAELDRLVQHLDSLEDAIDDTQGKAHNAILQSATQTAGKLREAFDRIAALETAGGRQGGGGSGGGHPHIHVNALMGNTPPSWSGGGGGGGPPPFPGNAQGGGPTIPIDTMMIETDGSNVMTLRQLVDLVRLHDTRTATLEGMVHARGGVTFNKVHFASEEAVVDLLNQELGGNPDAMADVASCFVSASSWFIHNSLRWPTEKGQQQTKELEKVGFSEEQRKLSTTLATKYPHWYTLDKEVVPGKPVAAFASVGAWKGVDAQKGARDEMGDALVLADGAHATFVGDALPANSTLASIALAMMKTTGTWVHRIHTHFDSELTKLTQLGLKPTEALQLASEELVIIYNKLFESRMQAIKLKKHGDMMKFTSRAIYVTLLEHQAMEEFTKDDPQYNPLISAAFIRFLTKHIGGNAVTKQLDDVKTLANAAKSAAATAKKDADSAKHTAEAAKSTASKVQSDFDAHKNHFTAVLQKNNLKK